MVRMIVYGKAAQKNEGTHEELRAHQPARRLNRAKMKQISTIEVTITQIENHSHSNNQNGHPLAVHSHSKGKNERAVQIMSFPHNQKNNRNRIGRAVSQEKKSCHADSRDGFHDNPAGSSPYLRPPTPPSVPAIGCCYQKQRYEDKCSQNKPGPQQHAEKLGFIQNTILHSTWHSCSGSPVSN